MPDAAGQPDSQHGRKAAVRGRNDEPYPPEPVPEQLPMGTPAHERKRSEDRRGAERERRRVVPCLAHRRMQAIWVRRNLSRPSGHGASSHRPPGWRHYRTAVTDSPALNARLPTTTRHQAYQQLVSLPTTTEYGIA
jgi:hypothetical protein